MRAGIRDPVARPYRVDPIPGEPRRTAIIDGLVRLRKVGRLQAVWIDQDVIRVRLYSWEQPWRLTWENAAALILSVESAAGKE